MSLPLRLWHLVPKRFQLLTIRTAQRNKRLYRWLMFRHASEKDRTDPTRAHLPPPELRYRVGASVDANEFVNVGKLCAADIEAALRKTGFELASFNRILDFGCGCGRTLVHVKKLAPNAHIEGIDIDARAIDWCKQNLTFATFASSQELPPTSCAADSFDFVYVISVFTHLAEDYQFRWLEELRRIIKPGGVLLLTVHGLEGDRGFIYERSYEKGLFPGWYQNSFHSKQYVYENFPKYFQVLDYFPRAMGQHQDVVVLQKEA